MVPFTLNVIYFKQKHKSREAIQDYDAGYQIASISSPRTILMTMGNFLASLCSCIGRVIHSPDISTDYTVTLTDSVRNNATVPPIDISKSYEAIRDDAPVPPIDTFEPTEEAIHNYDLYEGPHLRIPAEWISNCVKNHKACAEILQPVYRPNRLIDLGCKPEFQDARLVESSAKDAPVKYLAISYCRGPTMPEAAKTHSSTLDEQKEHLNVDALPRTFLHFFEVARRLAVRYVWIDALCIVQDSDLDWQLESACMGRIYSNALCTIAAESSPSCYGGLWLESGVGNVNFGAYHHPDLTQDARVKAYLSTTDQRIWKSPLQARGWALQEREVSPRVLHFTYAHLFWECRTLRTDCTALLGGCRGVVESDSSIRASGLEWKSSHLRTFDTRHISSDLADKSSSPVRLQKNALLSARYVSIPHRLAFWRETIEDYSGRAFTRRSDRLPALSGLAAELEQVMNSEYIAGIWTVDLPRSLLWRPDNSRRRVLWKQPPSADSYQAPSWSWASFPGAITYEDVYQAMEIPQKSKQSNLQVEAVEASVVPEGLDPNGRLAGGFIRLRGRVRWFRDTSSSTEAQFTSIEALTNGKPDNESAVLRGSHIRPDRYEQGRLHRSVLAISIINSNSSFSLGLVLFPTKKAENEFRRIGRVDVPYGWFDSGLDMEVTIV